MSDENLINVEDDQPEAVAPAAPEAPVAPEPPVVAAPDAEIDINSIDIKDEGRIKGVIGELSRIRAENRTLKTQAERAGQLEQQLNEAKPYVDFLRNNQHLMQPRQPEPVAPPPEADPDLVETARTLDLYTSDGKLDLEKAGKVLAIQDRRAGRVAQTTIQPMQQQTMQSQAHANYQMLRSFKMADGQVLRQEIVDGIWQATAREPNGLQTLSNPDSVRALALLAIGAQAMTTRSQPAPPVAPPVVTEASGGRGSLQPQRLSAIEERVLQNKGLSATKYQELTKDFKPGVSNVLED